MEIAVIVLFLVCLSLLVNASGVFFWLESNPDKLDQLSDTPSIEMVKVGHTYAVLLLHEFAGTPQSLSFLGESLFHSGMDVYIPSLPGSALTPLAQEKLSCYPHFDLLVNYARREYERLLTQYERVYLVGASLGGSVALELATEKNPDGIALISSPVKLTGSHFRKTLLRNTMIFFSGFISLFAKKVMTGKLSEEARKIEVFEGVEGVIYPVAIHINKIRLSRLRHKLRDIRCPLLLLHSPQDRTVDYRNSVIIAKAVSSRFLVQEFIDLHTDQLTRCHRLANHLWVRERVAKSISNFLSRL